MPYRTLQDLPPSVRHVLPEHAQTIFLEAFNHAHETYKTPQKREDPEEPLEEVCFKVAWAAVKKTYEKGSDERWHLKKQA